MPNSLSNPRLGFALALLPVACLLAGAGSAHALTMKECSAKYQQAKKDNTLNGATWQSFRTTQCGADSAGAKAPATAAAAPGQPGTPAPAPSGAASPMPSAAANAPAPSAATRSAAPAAASGAAVFPTAVSPKYASEKAGQARMHTCLDQYKANKASNANGGMTWIQKGGGYFSECTKRLKGEA